MSYRILVIEDERHIAEGLKLNLELAHYNVEVASDGKEGLKKWQSYKPHLVLLDIMMPELDGHKVLEEMRKSDPQLPILILSAKNASVDKVKAFHGGVDDYLGKPFSVEELLLRIERLLLRASWGEHQGGESEVVEFGPHKVDLSLFKAITPHGTIELTDQETKLLRYFFLNPHKVLKRAELLEAGWGYAEDINTRTLDNFMVRFRKYFEKEPKKPRYFCSVRGVGYIFNPKGRGRAA